MKVLVIALEGQIRDALQRQLSSRGREYRVVGAEWLGLEVSGEMGPTPEIPADIDMIVNTVTLDCLQRFGDERLLASMQRLAPVLEQVELPTLMLSTCRVFDGCDSGRHKETEAPQPDSDYARIQVEHEQWVEQHLSRYIILRTGALFSAHDDNILTRLLADIEAGKTLTVSNRMQFCPVHSDDLARVISAVVDQLSCGIEPWGIYHYCSADPASSFQFVETVMAVLSQFQAGIDPAQRLQEQLVLSDQPMGDQWVAPLLNCDKIQNTFGIKQLPWRSYVVSSVKAIYQNFEEASREQS